MPYLKTLVTYKPPWVQWEKQSNKNGMRHTIYAVNGNKYTGEWKDNKFHGLGKFIRKKDHTLYEGDWVENKREGFGTYCSPVKTKKISKGYNLPTYKPLYIGKWKNNKFNGYGEYYYSDTSHYEGEWVNGNREGWGRMFYENGDIYEGQWKADERNGFGLYRKSTLDRYEGEWKNGKKHGLGKYFYMQVGQLLDGLWVKDVPKCGELLDVGREMAIRPPKYLLPPIQILYPDQLLRQQKNCIMSLPEYLE